MLNREQEKALKVIRKLERRAINSSQVQELVAWDCLASLVGDGYARWTFSDPGLLSSGLDEDRIELTLKGRNYRSDRRREWLDKNWPSLLGMAGTLLGIVLGFFIGKLA